jgi:hypothetical protein
MVLPNVRRLAAVDMWGAAGTKRRRLVIRAEFVIGAVGCTVLGALALTASRWQISVGVWLVGAGINYVPLALHAQSLSRLGASEAELAEVDPRRELRAATISQFWIAVPFAVAIASLIQATGRGR